MLTQILLESEGFEVRMAEDAIQAIDLLRSYRPKLILMDIQMPGMDGLELTRKLRRDVQFENVMIVALTAYAMRGDEEAARSAGCDGYITKPINTRTFPTSVRAFFDA
jgi:CheY-like chemotaxis protein